MITPAQFNVFVTVANTTIGAVYESASVESVYTDFCQVEPSSSSQNEYAWTGMLNKMRLWNGPRISSEPAPQTYVLPNQAFEGPNVVIDRFRLDDDKRMYNVYWRMLADMARQARRQPDYMFRDLLENSGDQTGTRQLGLDGLPGFGTHYIDFYAPSKGTYINDFTGGGQNVTYAAPGGGTDTVLVGGGMTAAAVSSLWQYMATIPAEDNEPIGVTPNVIMVHPQLRLEAETVLRNTFYAPPSWGVDLGGQVGAAENALKRYGLDLVVNRFLKQAYTWYMCDTRQSFKPFIYQVREPVVFTPRINENDPVVYDNHQYQWGQWGRMAVGWGYPFLYARSSS